MDDIAIPELKYRHSVADIQIIIVANQNPPTRCAGSESVGVYHEHRRHLGQDNRDIYLHTSANKSGLYVYLTRKGGKVIARIQKSLPSSNQ